MGAGNNFLLGVDSNYALFMRQEGLEWRADAGPVDLFRLYSGQQVGWLRVRVWTGNDGPSGLRYAGQTALWGQNNGLRPYLVFFLSADWADLYKQPAPAPWRDMSVVERAEAVRDYSRDTARHFKDIGVATGLYEIGNEIDYGICGVFAGEGADRDNPSWMKENVWEDTAAIVKAGQAGIMDIDPKARFIIHLAHWWDPDFCVAYFQDMLASGVQIDYLGLSYFPTSGAGLDNTLSCFGKTVRRITETIERPLLVAEYAYPSSPDISGQFSTWTAPVPGYPLSPAGQADWLRDFIGLCHAQSGIAGAFYWSPEWYTSEIWHEFSLFFPGGEAKPALRVFHKPH